MKKILLDTNAYTRLLAGDEKMLDVWVAAHGIETGSTVITYDRHFKKISGLRLWN